LTWNDPNQGMGTLSGLVPLQTSSGSEGLSPIQFIETWAGWRSHDHYIKTCLLEYILL